MLFFQFYFNTLQTIVLLTFCRLLLLYCYLSLKVKHSPIVLWELISCWCSCCYCCCCCESWYSACAVVLILLHQRSAWIIMASDCKAMPRASLHIIMRWRDDWCQMNTYYLERKQPHFQNDTDMLLSLMDFWGAGKVAQHRRENKVISISYLAEKAKKQKSE